jgi:PAS domain S-box-containing protein
MNSESNQPPANHRILVIDDNPSIHEDFRTVLGARGSQQLRDLESEEASIFGEPQAPSQAQEFEITSAFQGEEGLQAVRAAAAAGNPFAMAFVDVRMPPGWDGIETITRIWKEFPELQMVICTAYSDYSWDQIASALGQTDNLLILKKPFDSVEVLQLAHALTKKWHLSQVAKQQLEHLDSLVGQRTAELRAANEQLKSEVAERTAAELALRNSEERFSKAFHSSPVPMAIQSEKNGRFVDANASFLHMAGYQREALVSSESISLWHDESTSLVVHELLSQNSPPRDLPVAIRTQAGERRDTLLSVEQVELGGEPHLLLIAQDITERTRLEDQLRQAQKMEAVGRLAAGIAHDFNNLLTVILGNASVELGNPRLDQNLAKSLQQVMTAGERATELTRQLLAYSRRQIIQRRQVNLNDVVAQTTSMLHRIIGEDIALTTDNEPELKPIYADPVNVDQVIMNLSLNARDAMPDGGKLTIGSRLVNLDASDLAGRPEAQPGEYVCLSIRDTGCGMDPATQARIFEPFFTTKEMGRGTGMGLATVYGIVKQHGGWIEVESDLGRGSTFRVYFPVYDGLVSIDESQPPPPRNANGPTGTVLVVEDEEMLREFVGSVLESCGHRVLTAANGVEALDVWSREKEGIDLVFTDVVMPESISGWQLGHRLRAERPELKVVYTSGYSPELIGGEFEHETDRLFLAKPYHSDRLVQMVSDCLAR